MQTSLESRSVFLFYIIHQNQTHRHLLPLRSRRVTGKINAELENQRSYFQQRRFLITSSKFSSTYHQRKHSSETIASEVIYLGSLAKGIHVTKFVSLTSSILGLAIQPYLISQATTVHPAFVVVVGSFVCLFTYITPLAIHWLTKRYVIELQFNPKSGIFTCTTLSFFMRLKQMTFQASDVTVPEIPGPFTSFLVKGIPLFVDPRQFSDPDAYRLLMGYDKPIDLKLGKLESDEADQSRTQMEK